MVLVDAQDEVLIPSPYWVSYPEMVNLCGGSPVFIPTSPANNFKVKPAELERRISPKTKVLILNSPSNPTGCVYGQEELKAIAEICVKKGIFVISDEIYEKIIFDRSKHVSLAGFNPDIYNLTVTVNGLSKSHSMTGWRIGYLGAPADIAEAISRLQDHSTSNPASIAQKAALAALNGPDDFSRSMCAQFQSRRDYVVARIKKMKKINCVVPQGAFYIFCGIKDTGLSSADFARRLLEEKLVALIPGEGFGNDEYVRISFAAGMEQLKSALDRIEEWL
jgi:aspartate aminotransferase